MKRTFLFALFPLILLIMLLPGCDKQSDAISMEPDGSTQVENEVPADPDPIAETDPIMIGEPPEDTVVEPVPAEDPALPPTYVVIQNASPTDPQLLVRQLQQVLPKTQVVKQVQSPNPREIKLEVSTIKDVKALANKIPFGSVESVDAQMRTITVDFDL